ncbi:type III-B CRISPR module-associated Cmr3 family protein [Psychrobacter arenosus]|uniref:type III-B CRISPR module-associated Cmr3 family protein n=1 Tax=Psychrobacter arenosus TaxID=256326 RepID=UPI001917ABEF|nr:type III-B CRISPR module-associated Cmr3 family protein [Psychrobacter arenosus]
MTIYSSDLHAPRQALVSFEQVDSWFFRESRPHGSVGTNALSSVFPPPTRTLMGSLRSLIGHQYFAQNAENTWSDLDNLPQLKAVIGNAHHLGSLSPRGVFIRQNNTNYLPIPSTICHKLIDNVDHYLALQPTEAAYDTDQGAIKLLQLPATAKDISDTRGFKPIESAWLGKSNWEKLLAGQLAHLSEKDSIKHQTDFMSTEERLGIQVNPHIRGIEEGQLYQTSHIRLESNTEIVMPICYDDSQLNEVLEPGFIEQSHLVRLGGEARMASLNFTENVDYLPQAPSNLTVTDNSKKHFIIYLLTKLKINGESWVPEGFAYDEHSQEWQGNILGLDINLMTACIAKAHREGGWDQLQHKPREIVSYLPAGTVFFVSVNTNINDQLIIDALHGKPFLQKDEWGEGVMLVGRPISN